MNVNVFDMNDGRANFMEAFEAKFGRLETVTRKQLVEFENSWPIGATGPKRAIPLRWPAWLTGNEIYRSITTGSTQTKLPRGTFRMPWSNYDEFIPVEAAWNTEEANQVAAKNAQRAEKEAAKNARIEAREASRTAREATKAAKLQARVDAAAKRLANKQHRLDMLAAKRAEKESQKATREANKTVTLSNVVA